MYVHPNLINRANLLRFVATAAVAVVNTIIAWPVWCWKSSGLSVDSTMVGHQSVNTGDGGGGVGAVRAPESVNLACFTDACRAGRRWATIAEQCSTEHEINYSIRPSDTDYKMHLHL